MDNLHCSHHQACHSPPVLHFNTPDHHCYHAIRDGNDEKRINRRDQRCKKISQIYHIISTDTICKVIITSQIEGFKLARNVKTYGTYLLQSTLIKKLVCIQYATLFRERQQFLLLECPLTFNISSHRKCPT